MADPRQQQFDKIREQNAADTEPPAGDYDPHEFRSVLHGTNFIETLIHVLKASLGTGMLAMPEAFKHAGLLNGTIFTLVIGLICTYGIQILVRAQYKLCIEMRIPYLTYPIAMKASLLVGPRWMSKFATTSQIMVDIFLIVYQTGACCAYVIFVANNIQALTAPYFDKPMHIELIILYLFIPFLLILSIPNLKWLAPFSLLSNILTFAICGIILYYIFADLPSLEGRHYMGKFSDFPLFVGTTLFAVAAMGCITTVEKNMQTPRQFWIPFGVLNISMTVITLSYLIIGFLGYWRWGEDTLPSITLNLNPNNDPHDVPSKVVQGLYIVAIYISYALNGFVPLDIIWFNYLIDRYKNKDNRFKLIFEYAIRFGIVVVTFILAISIPMLSLIISLFGAFCMSALEIIFPAIMDLCVKWPDELGRYRWVLISDIIMIILGMVGLVAGTYCSIRDIVAALKIKHGKD